MNKFQNTLIWILVSLLLWNCNPKKNLYRLDHFKNGYLDLSGQSLSEFDKVLLQGEWEFYWNEFYDSSKPKTDFKYASPGETWSSLTSEKTGVGFATYCLNIQFSEEDIGKRMFLKIFHAGGAAQKVFIDNEPKLELGRIGTNRETMKPTRQGGEIFFTVKKPIYLLTIQISNYYHHDGALWYPPYLREETHEYTRMQIRQAEDSLIWGTILLIFLHHVFIFWKRPNEKGYLYFAIYGILIVIQLMSLTNSDFFYVLFPNISYKLLFSLSLVFTIIMPFYLLFLHSLFPKELSKKWINGITGILFFIYALIVILPSEMGSRFTVICLLATLTSILYSNYAVVLSLLRKRKYAISIFLTLIMIGIGTINDILYAYNLIHTEALIKYAYLVSVIIQSLVLSGKFSDTMQSEEILIRELQKSNEELEGRVQRRTKQLQMEKENAEQANLWKDKFMILASHDLRSPLHTLKGTIEILENNPKPDLIQSLLAGSKSLIQNSIDTIDHLLRLSRFQATSVKLDYSDVDLLELSKELEEEFGILIKKKSLQCINQIPVDTILTVDRNILFEILRNLILNAIKYNQEGGIIILSYEETSDYQIIKVKDTGIGLRYEEINHLFEGQKQRPGTAGERGYGVGLKLTKDLIELHKGKIEVQSELGQGTEFLVYLPSNRKLSLVFSVHEKKDQTYIPLEGLKIYSQNTKETIDLIRKISFESILLDDSISITDRNKIVEILKEEGLHSQIGIFIMPRI